MQNGHGIPLSGTILGALEFALLLRHPAVPFFFIPSRTLRTGTSLNVSMSFCLIASQGSSLTIGRLTASKFLPVVYRNVVKAAESIEEERRPRTPSVVLRAPERERCGAEKARFCGSAVGVALAEGGHRNASTLSVESASPDVSSPP